MLFPKVIIISIKLVFRLLLVVLLLFSDYYYYYYYFPVIIITIIFRLLLLSLLLLILLWFFPEVGTEMASRLYLIYNKSPILLPHIIWHLNIPISGILIYVYASYCSIVYCFVWISSIMYTQYYTIGYCSIVLYCIVLLWMLTTIHNTIQSEVGTDLASAYY